MLTRSELTVADDSSTAAAPQAVDAREGCSCVMMHETRQASAPNSAGALDNLFTLMSCATGSE